MYRSRTTPHRPRNRRAKSTGIQPAHESTIRSLKKHRNHSAHGNKCENKIVNEGIGISGYQVIGISGDRVNIL